MLYRELLMLKPIEIAFVDPGIDETGLCIYEHKRIGKNLYERKILHCKRILPISEKGSLQQRSLEIMDNLSSNLLNCRIVIIEQPPQTIYNSRVSTKKMIIARAQNVFKLFFVVGFLICGLQTRTDLKCKVYSVIPKQWQPGKKQRNGLDIKKWSLNNAQKILMDQNFPLNQCKVSSDVADAISIGDKILDKIESDKMNFKV